MSYSGSSMAPSTSSGTSDIPTLAECLATVRAKCLHDRPHRGLFWLMMSGSSQEQQDTHELATALSTADRNHIRHRLHTLGEIREMVADLPKVWLGPPDDQWTTGSRDDSSLVKTSVLMCPSKSTVVDTDLMACAFSILGFAASVHHLRIGLNEGSSGRFPHAWVAAELAGLAPASQAVVQEVIAQAEFSLAAGRSTLSEPFNTVARAYRDQKGKVHDLLDQACESMNAASARFIGRHLMRGAIARDDPIEIESLGRAMGLHAVRGHDIAAGDARRIVGASPNIRSVARALTDPSSRSTTLLGSILFEGGTLTPATWGTHRRFGDIDEFGVDGHHNAPEMGCLGFAAVGNTHLEGHERTALAKRLDAMGHDVVIARRRTGSDATKSSTSEGVSMSNGDSVTKECSFSEGPPRTYRGLPIVSAAIDDDAEVVLALMELGADPYALVGRKTTYKVVPTVSADCALDVDNSCATVIRSHLAREAALSTIASFDACCLPGPGA